MNTPDLPTTRRAQQARVLCTVTFHFVRGRLGMLADVLRSLSEYDVARMDVVLVTNASREAELGLLRRLGSDILAGRRFAVRSYGDLSDPWRLTWCHKEILAREFVDDPADRYTHFLQLEGDIRLSFVNFCYFIEFREVLRGVGLLPAFIRVEFSGSLGGLVASDAFWPVYVPVQPHLVIGDLVMANMPNPYNPCFILDAALAREYVQSRSFDPEASRAVCPWGVPERAAMGLCLENVPPRFQSRYVVPVSRRTGSAPAFALISHLPNNYADNAHSPLGKVRIDNLFAGAGELTSDGAWRPGDATLQWTGGRGRRRATGDTGPAEEGAGVIPGRGSARNSGERYHLVSHHDTVVFFDEHLRVLRHAPFGIALANLVVELGEGHGRLLVVGRAPAQDYPLSRAASSGEVHAPQAGEACDYEVDALADGQISLRAGEVYLTAQYDGVVRNGAPWCRDWECYCLVREDTLAGLLLMRRYSWLSPADRRIVSLAAQPLDFGRTQPSESSALAATLAPGALDLRRELVFGPARLRLVGRKPTILADDCDAPPARLAIVDSSGAAHEFLRFTPLVHYDVRGDDGCYERLRSSLDSLERFGCFGGTLGVACDRPASELLRYIPEAFRDRLIVSRSEQDQEPPSYRVHQPVLRCGVDVAFDADITELLIERLMSPEAT
jgi:hypothetical protein